MPAVDLNSFDEPYFQALKDDYQKRDRELWVLDISCDLKIPVFVAISKRIDKAVEDIIFGFGAHFDPKIGILRALTEMNQMLSSVSSINPDGSTLYPDKDQDNVDWLNWLQTATLANKPYLVPNASIAPKVSADYPQLWSDDLLNDVMTCAKIAEKHDLEVLVLDQTRPDIGLNVVKVLIPGLRPFWNRFAPGRLYDIPVKMGWLPKPLKEEQLNSVLIFF